MEFNRKKAGLSQGRVPVCPRDGSRFVPGTGPGLSQGRVLVCLFLCLLALDLPEFWDFFESTVDGHAFGNLGACPYCRSVLDRYVSSIARELKSENALTSGIRTIVHILELQEEKCAQNAEIGVPSMDPYRETTRSKSVNQSQD